MEEQLQTVSESGNSGEIIEVEEQSEIVTNENSSGSPQSNNTEVIDLCESPSTSSGPSATSEVTVVSSACQTNEETEISVDHNTTASTSNNSTTTTGNANANVNVTSIECPICLQTCIHPARLPCGHIFCFLCVKGVAYKNRRCAMCRREIPPEFLDHPHLVNGIQDICKTKATEDGYQWFYEGRNGWWQYDDRTSQDIEEAYKKGDNTCTILVAGYVYVVDFEAMLQQRQNEPSRCRHVKRDLATIPKKGVAGLRIEGNTVTTDSNFVSQVYQSTLLGFDSIEEASRAASAASVTINEARERGLSRPPTNASDFVSTIAATDAAIRIASDIIGSTLAHADELTRGRSMMTESPATESLQHANLYGENGSRNVSNSNYLVPSWSALEVARGSRELLGAAEDLLDATQSVISEADQQTIDLFEQTLNDFHSLTLRNIVDSSDDDDNDDNLNGQIRF